MIPTLIASVPITPVSMNSYVPPPGEALRPATMSSKGCTSGVFSSSISPMMSASSLFQCRQQLDPLSRQLGFRLGAATVLLGADRSALVATGVEG